MLVCYAGNKQDIGAFLLYKRGQCSQNYREQQLWQKIVICHFCVSLLLKLAFNLKFKEDTPDTPAGLSTLPDRAI